MSVFGDDKGMDIFAKSILDQISRLGDKVDESICTASVAAAEIRSFREESMRRHQKAEEEIAALHESLTAIRADIDRIHDTVSQMQRNMYTASMSVGAGATILAASAILFWGGTEAWAAMCFLLGVFGLKMPPVIDPAWMAGASLVLGATGLSLVVLSIKFMWPRSWFSKEKARQDEQP